MGDDAGTENRSRAAPSRLGERAGAGAERERQEDDERRQQKVFYLR